MTFLRSKLETVFLETPEEGFDSLHVECHRRVEDNRIIKVHMSGNLASDDAFYQAYESARDASMSRGHPQKLKNA